MKITAILKSAEKITGQKGCYWFEGEGWSYLYGLNKLADGRRVEITIDPDSSGTYDYIFEGYHVKKEWLEDIREEVEAKVCKK